MSLKELRGMVKPPARRHSLDDLRQAADDLKYLKEAFLRERGWLSKCDSPGSYWYFEKEINGKRWVAFRADDAIDMQKNIEWREPHRFEEPCEGPENACALCGEAREEQRHA